MRSRPCSAASLFALSIVLVPGLALAGFTGFEPRGFPEERPNGAGPEREYSPSLSAFRVNGEPIRVDGKLDESAWGDAQTAHGFLRWHPDRGRKPTEETIFKVAYDSDAVYFAVACLEEDCANIASSLSRRDRIRDSDLVSIYIDPYHDMNTGYNFRVNPAGVQEDSYLFNDGDRDQDWNAVWQAETHRDDDGWYAEVRIPFSSIRYRPQSSMTWGLQVYRYMHRRGEDTAWVVWDQESRGFVSRFGELRDLEDVPAPRQLEVLPYFVQRSTNPALDGPEDEIQNFHNFGADLKYGVTADLTLNATIQPDFGQVEADPAVVNRSPFETHFDEKRPFFIEGNRFFQTPGFTTFYSRRIGLEDENSRIRSAAKLTGKVAGNTSLAALYATTDVTTEGQAHNFFKRGEDTAHYFAGRFGKDLDHGNHQFHVTQTAALRSAERESVDDDGLAYRDGYTTAVDFALNFADRKYNVSGIFVGSIVDPAEVRDDPSIDHSAKHGTGGQLSLGKYGGVIRSEIWGRWESERLDINDMGFLSAPDEIVSGGWVGWRYKPSGKTPKLNEANLNFNVHKSWLYAGAREIAEGTGDVLWDYGPGHRQRAGGNVNGYGQFRSYWGAFAGVEYAADRTDRFITRGGPLMTRPAEYGGWAGFHSDRRKKFFFELDGVYFVDDAGGYYARAELETDWNASNAMSYALDVQLSRRQERAEYLDTIEHGDPAFAIGGKSYVFGDLDERTVKLTFRSNFLFSRDKSLELYVQPFLSAGDFTNARELVTPNSYELAAYPEDGYSPGPDDDLRAEDFSDLTAAVNLNMVFRWEYRPGSTFYLVWTHSRRSFEEAGDAPGRPFDNELRASDLFNNEPENILLAKFTYWFSI